VSRDALVDEIVDRITAFAPERRVRVAVDGAPAASPQDWAEDLVDPLRVHGRPVLHVPAEGFLRPASERFELGRTNPDAFYEGWRDDAGLRREVLDPAGPAGSGRVLPSLWDAATDRATRAAYVDLAPGAVVLVSGPMLLGAGLPFDLEVHLELSAAALARSTPPEETWTLPAFARYAEEVAPAGFAHMVVRINDPRHPALVER
jgi:hypothetical protein